MDKEGAPGVTDGYTFLAYQISVVNPNPSYWPSTKHITRHVRFYSTSIAIRLLSTP